MPVCVPDEGAMTAVSRVLQTSAPLRSTLQLDLLLGGRRLATEPCPRAAEDKAAAKACPAFA
jgi:hypothetical protein